MTEKRDTAISDEALAARAKEEAWAQECLLERYKPLVRAQAASYYLPGADAEDLVQEGMIGLFRAIQDFDPAKGAFGSFAKLCVQRQVISAVKASTRQKHQLLNEFVSFDARTDGQHALRDVLPGPQEEEPEALILQKQRLDEVHQAMETTLSELELEVLLRHISGESYQQIAMALDRPEKSVLFYRLRHPFSPPRGLLRVHLSMYGVRMFINRMEKETPSG